MSRRVARRFLQRVWAVQPVTQEGRVAFLSVKDWDDNSWEDCPIPLELDDDGIPILGKLPTIKDLYFAPCTFKNERRRKEHALPGRWLYADLDEVDPRTVDIEPTIAWETSPGRYQALWQLDRALRPEQLQILNQKLTYHTGADKGGWSLTKVLRVPGSTSHKREYEYTVQNLWTEGPTYGASEIYDKVKSTVTPRTVAAKLPPLKLPKASASRLRRKYREDLPMTARRLLRASEAPEGTRSERLWKLERLLIEAGVKPEHAFVMVKASVWNKYRGQEREDDQLWREINQAVVSSGPQSGIGVKKTSPETDSSQSTSARAERGRRSTSSSSSTEHQRLLPVALSDFADKRIHRPAWMVEGIWSESAHGLIAGMPKTYKSVIATDLAISVASGTRFLDRFEVPQVGPVLMIQKENDEGMVQDRVLRILHSRGLGAEANLNGDGFRYKPPAELPLHFINNPDIDIADEDDMQLVADLVDELRPILLILDPLYLLAPSVDENSAHQMTPILAALLQIKQKYNCGTLLIHHYHKPPADESSSVRKGASRISGTGAFHRWYESVMLLERPDYEEPTIKVYTEHRGQSPRPAFEAEIDLGSAADLYYHVGIELTGRQKVTSQKKQIGAILSEADGYVRVDQIAAQIGAGMEATKRRLDAEGFKIAKKRIDGRVRSVVRGES